jgi:hypothetical protein
MLNLKRHPADGEENFTVTEPNDIIFLDYFYQRCIAEDEVRTKQDVDGRDKRGRDE